ncbi:MAG: cobalt-precorrin-5B (C(1))-methyltransferase CbiD [Bacillota bacterium]|nr:cobalt-precorrin-5B (C(1))-methyltransferase CbiD [Bacillota bacterium]
MERYKIVKGKKLRYGYTTGSCAAAAAKASAKMLRTQKNINYIDLDTPKGWRLKLKVEEQEYDENSAAAAIIKDAGDDPDITDGIKIFAKVSFIKEKTLEITGGIGVGKITKDGLSVPVGEYAINTIPKKMIENELKKIFPENGLRVEIWIPEGEKIAKKTFNPRLGIIGGISVIGTSGIVEPMSEEAFKESIKLEMKMFMKSNRSQVIFTFGNYGINFCKERGIKDKNIIKTSNFIGDMLDEALNYEIKEILIIGHIGKLIKVAGSIFNTHSKIADCRMEILAAYTGIRGGNKKILNQIMKSNTTEEGVEVLKNQKQIDCKIVFNEIVEAVKSRCEKRVYNKIDIEVVMFSQKRGLLGMTKKAKERMIKFNGE